jgi:hypothetical protein
MKTTSTARGATTLPNLAKQLGEVVEVLAPYWDLERALQRRASLMVLHPRRMIKALAILRRHREELGRDPATLDMAVGNRELRTVLATDAEQASEAFAVTNSDFPMDYLARALTARFPDVDFEKMRSLFESSRNSVKLELKQVLGLGLAAGSLLLKTVPKPVVERYLGTPYDDFQVIVFWITMAVTAYIGLVLAPIWFIRARYRARHRFIQEVLDYTATAVKT